MPSSYAEALRIIHSLATTHKDLSPLAFERIPVFKAVGRTSSVDVSSPASLPPFDISAMDGYAVSSAVTQSASVATPLTLTVIGCIAAGDSPLSANDVTQHPATAAANDNVCYEIMTGAPFPNTGAAFDACIRLEDSTASYSPTTKHVTSITITRPVAPHSHRRHAGEDIALGSHLLSRGQLVTPEHVLALSAVGVQEVAVCRRLKVGVVSTGRELQSQVADCNAPYIVATLQSWGFEATHIGTVYDDRQQFEQLLTPLLRVNSITPPSFDLLISTGAVSMGKFDFVPASVASLAPTSTQSATVHFHKLNIRPGHPALLASLNPTLPLFALPGNPIATVICLRFLVYPYLAGRMGWAREKAVWARLVGGREVKARRDVVGWQKGRLCVAGVKGGGLVVRCVKDTGSLTMHPLLEAGAVWVELPEGVEAVEDGSLVRIYPLQPERSQFGSSYDEGRNGYDNNSHTDAQS